MANGIELAKAYVQVIPTTENFKSHLKESLGGEGEDAGKTLGSSINDGLKRTIGAVAKTAAAAIGTGVAAFGALSKSAVESYADYEQLTGGIETLFKESSGTVMGYAQNAYKTAQMSANDYMEMATSFSASLLQGLGGDTQKAAQMSNLAITDMADNANKMGSSMESIQNAYLGFAKNNYTMLDNLKLGYGGTASEMLRLVKDSGVVDDSISSIKDVSFDQIIEGIHIVQDRMGITGTSSQEAATTISGSIGMMSSAWTNFLTGMADGSQDFGSLLDNLIQSILAVADNLVPRLAEMLPRLAEGLTSLINGLVPYLPEILATLLPPLIEGAISLVNGIVLALPTILEALIGTFPTIVDALWQIVPQVILSIVGAIPLLIEALVLVIQQLVSNITANLPLFIDSVLEIITQIIAALIAGCSTVDSGRHYAADCHHWRSARHHQDHRYCLARDRH